MHIVHAFSHAVAGSIHLEVSVWESFLTFVVTDTGVGVSTDQQSNIWDPFYSSDGGTGLGLYLVKMQTEALGGRSGLQENLATGRGSVFWFQIPYVPSDGTDALQSSAGPAGQSTQGILWNAQGNAAGAGAGEHGMYASGIESASILLIDDTPLVLETHGLELRQHGYTVCYCSSDMDTDTWARAPADECDMLVHPDCP